MKSNSNTKKLSKENLIEEIKKQNDQIISLLEKILDALRLSL